MSFVRSDGRAGDELRPLTITPGYLPYAEGSALIEWARLVWSVLLPSKIGFRRFCVTPARDGSQRSIRCCRVLRSNTPREVRRGGPSGRTHEIQRLIGRSLRAAADMKLLGERTITLDCDVLQADGGENSCTIRGVCTCNS